VLHHITNREKLIVMLAVMSGLFLVALDQTIIATALGAIVTEFDSFSSIGFIVTAYLLTSTVTVPLAGKLSDMYGRRVILISGVILFTLASLVSGIAPNVESLIAARALQGIGGGMIMANAFTIIGDLFSPRERGKWQGLIGAVFGVSSVVGPLLGGFLTDSHTILGLTTNWRWTFFINIPIGIIATFVIARYCPAIKHDSEHKPDYLGAAFITVALASLVLSVDNTDVIFKALIDQGIAVGVIKAVLTAIAVAAGIAFVLIEKRAKQPIISLDFFKNRTFTLMVSAMLLFGAAFLGAILYLTQFNQQVFGASASEAGLMLLPMVGGLMLASIGTGQIVSRVGKYKRFILIGFALAATGMLSLITLTPDSPYWHEALIMAFTGFGLGMGMPILNLAVQNEFEQKDLGSATASVQLFRGLGSTIGTALMSGILTAGILSAVGAPGDIPYVQTLKKSPESAKMLGSEISADTLLQVNSQKDTIRAGAEQSFSAIPSEKLQQKVRADFTRQQDDFSRLIVDAFTTALHHIFLVSSVLMVIAFIIVSFVKEKPLRSGMSPTPGE
jgi:EmrB/QacA subfamily drug resistance transporter